MAGGKVDLSSVLFTINKFVRKLPKEQFRNYNQHKYPMESPLAVANYFITKSLETGQLLTNMKLVKLVYLAHGWHLGLTNQPLISEGTEAWKYGPVVPSVYDNFKFYRGNPITQLAHTVTPTGQISYFPLSDPKLTEFLDRIWDVYNSYSAVELSALTHQENSPWYETWHQNGGKEKYGVVIPNERIEKHYKKIAESNLKAHAAA